MENTIEKKGNEKSPKSFSQIALNNEAIKVLDELIKLEGSNRIGASSVSRSSVLNDLLTNMGAKKLRDFYYSSI